MKRTGGSSWAMQMLRWSRPGAKTVPNRATDAKRRPTAPAYTAFPSGVGMDWKTGQVHTGDVRKTK